MYTKPLRTHLTEEFSCDYRHWHFDPVQEFPDTCKLFCPDQQWISSQPRPLHVHDVPVLIHKRSKKSQDEIKLPYF